MNIRQSDLDLIADQTAFAPQPPEPEIWDSWLAGIGFIVLFAGLVVFAI